MHSPPPIWKIVQDLQKKRIAIMKEILDTKVSSSQILWFFEKKTIKNPFLLRQRTTIT